MKLILSRLRIFYFTCLISSVSFTQDFQGIALRNDNNYTNTSLSNRSIDMSTTKIAAQYAYELPIDATQFFQNQKDK